MCYISFKSSVWLMLETRRHPPRLAKLDPTRFSSAIALCVQNILLLVKSDARWVGYLWLFPFLRYHLTGQQDREESSRCDSKIRWLWKGAAIEIQIAEVSVCDMERDPFNRLRVDSYPDNTRGRINDASVCSSASGRATNSCP